MQPIYRPSEEERRRKLEKDVEEYQRRVFGEKYVGASLGKLDGPTWCMEAINTFLKKPKHLLIYHGSSGIGKTYFCAALTEWTLTNFNSRRYHREEDLLRRLRAGIGEGTSDYLINLEYLIDDEIVILDDVASGINPDKVSYRDLEFRREVFFSFLDYRYRTNKPTIITSNFNKNEFDKIYSERICSRLFATENIIIPLFDEKLNKRNMGM